MCQYHQGPVNGSLPGRINDPTSRLCLCDWTEHRLNSLREMKPTPCTARSGTNHSQLGLAPFTQFPGAVSVSKHRDLLLKQTTASVASTVMVSKQDRHRQGQLGDALDQAQISITEISHKEKGVRLQSLYQIRISFPPVTMEVSGNGNTE